MITVMCDPTTEHNGSTLFLHYVTSYLLFVLYKGVVMEWLNPTHVARALK